MLVLIVVPRSWSAAPPAPHRRPSFQAAAAADPTPRPRPPRARSRARPRAHHRPRRCGSGSGVTRSPAARPVARQDDRRHRCRAPQYDSRVSSGLITPELHQLARHAAEQLAQVDPEVVVFMIGTNDAIVYNRTRGRLPRANEAMMRVLIGGASDVYWVGPLVANDNDREERAGGRPDPARGRGTGPGRHLRRRAHAVRRRPRPVPAELHRRARRSGS